jgi:hypothetical protein
LLTTIAPQQFVEALVDPDGRHFLVFGSTIKPKGSIVEPTTNALRYQIHEGSKIVDLK